VRLTLKFSYLYVPIKIRPSTTTSPTSRTSIPPSSVTHPFVSLNHANHSTFVLHHTPSLFSLSLLALFSSSHFSFSASNVSIHSLTKSPTSGTGTIFSASLIALPASAHTRRKPSCGIRAYRTAAEWKRSSASSKWRMGRDVRGFVRVDIVLEDSGGVLWVYEPDYDVELRGVVGVDTCIP
jgi:hypothetical protein